MATFYTNTTTERLEAHARRVTGRDLGIVISPDNGAGRLFVVAVHGHAEPRWLSLGWTVAEAREAIRRWKVRSEDR